MSEQARDKAGRAVGPAHLAAHAALNALFPWTTWILILEPDAKDLGVESITNLPPEATAVQMRAAAKLLRAVASEADEDAEQLAAVPATVT